MNHPNYNNRFGIKPGQEITIDHLIALRIYFNYDQYLQGFRKTFKSEQTKDDPDHADYVHVARHIEEAIHLYGDTLPNLTNNNHLYHVPAQYNFPYLDAFFSGPVSTTRSLVIARQFYHPGNGPIIEVKDGESSDKDKCEWPTMYISASQMLSDYPDEVEYLMWGSHLKIVDMVWNGATQNAKKYISALRLLEKLYDGCVEFSIEEKEELLTDEIQYILTELIQWKYVDESLHNTRLTQLIAKVRSNVDAEFLAKICNALFENLKETKKFWRSIIDKFGGSKDLMEALKNMADKVE
eukprot:CAMPEP_0201578508 /NCGR_PEP_ID=MMETSP0190_2-20130828/25404_1 /ASSEMBLY_ACC=CAM_ASM_000263 /TAXON_ID=37353 /ORGANISM="Rosalina sp." /LENGTH=295 /DNA_ID=CAMNT_0048011763 /DNA_START=346 /DNA_END=1233 /DNA_ORIENTATION=+